MAHNGKTLSQSAQKDWRDFTILIAEDNPICYRYLEILLRDKVKRIDHAVNGEEAVELALKNRYDLILMDIKMPKMNGIEATKRIKQQFPDISIIAQTAHATHDVKAKALQAGCDGYITKPFTREELLEIISLVMNITNPPTST
jgi:CheY-like chemotaxis protein